MFVYYVVLTNEQNNIIIINVRKRKSIISEARYICQLIKK